MRLAEDDRGRVPFALVGVLLLVGSATFAATLATRSQPTVDRDAERSVERSVAAAQTALRDAVQRASRDAAAEPVLVSANTSTGRVLNASTPFRDALRVRIYLAARRELRSSAATVGDATATVSLAPTPNASALRRAKRRVTVESVGDPTSSGLRVGIENLTVTVRKSGDEPATSDGGPAAPGGAVVARESRTLTVVVASPVLAVHERVKRFEERLDNGPLSTGLGRRLTARLYPVVWARGYAQHGGAPIENVLANRHVELTTNGALLEEQRAAFGAADPDGRASMDRATARVGLTDLLVPTGPRGRLWADVVLGATDLDSPPGSTGSPDSTSDSAGSPDSAARAAESSLGVSKSTKSPKSPRSPESPATMAVGDTANRALVDFTAEREGDERSEFGDALASAYRVRVRLVASVRKVREESRPDPVPPGANRTRWTLSNRTTRTNVAVEKAGGASVGTPAGWHLFRTETRRIVRTHVVVWTWTDGNRTRTTTGRWWEEYVVALGVAGNHEAGVAGSEAPSRPVEHVHERGGPLSGPNLADVESEAVARLFADRGGVDRLAERAVDGTLDTRPETVVGDRPTGLRTRAYRDVRSLRDDVRNVSVTVQRGRLVGGANPPAMLAERLRDRRNKLLDVPARYDHVAERASVAARTAYLDRVLARLDRRAETTRQTNDELRAAVQEKTGVSLERIGEILRERRAASRPDPRPLPAGGPGRNVTLDVDGDPAYLTLTAVEHRHVSAVPPGERVHPLAARNVNLFTVPYGDAVDSVVSGLLGDGSGGGSNGGDRASLRAGALALRGANRTLTATENATLRQRRDDLRRSVASSLRDVERRLAADLRSSAVDCGAFDCHAAVRRGVRGPATIHDRALAVANGSAANAVVAALAAGGERSWTVIERDRVRLGVRKSLVEARKQARTKQSPVERTMATARKVAKMELTRLAGDAVGNLSERAQRRWFGKVLSEVPAGLPVAPVPGYWYATVNVWQVDVTGGYARFTVRAPQGTPATPGAELAYTRTAGVVRLDVDDDGSAERLGRTTPVSFEMGTTIVVAVPPNGRGVGDVNGNADERSPGWANRSDNPFPSPGRPGDHALRRDSGPGGEVAGGSSGGVRDRTRGDHRQRRRGRSRRPERRR